MSKSPDIQKWLIPKLRRISLQWKPRAKALKEARVARGRYECAVCYCVSGPKDVDLDHVNPVIDPVTGFVDWNSYIERLFAEDSGFQVLCKPCHHKKTHGNR